MLKRISNAEMLALAEKKIARSKGTRRLIFSNGKTEDIVNQVVACIKSSHNDVKEFAPCLKGAGIKNTCLNVWKFIKQNIEYKLDPYGEQNIKTPARIFADRESDCKGYNIFAYSVLKHNGIPCAARFVSYSGNPTYTHVYVAIPDGDKTYIIDCCMDGFNQEKPFTYKLDLYPMTKIYQVSGTEDGLGDLDGMKTVMRKKIINLGPKPVQDISAGEMDLLIARERLKIEKEIAEKNRGLGALKAKGYQSAIDSVEDALGIIDDPDAHAHVCMIEEDIVSGVYSPGLSGIGRSKEERRKRREERKKNGKGLFNKVKTKTGKFFKDAVDKAKAGIKSVVNAVTAPERMLAKAILEHTLPKAAPFFLYLFINDQKIIDKLPAKARKKRKKAENIANFIVNTLGMERSHFMGIVRNGIMKEKGASPETLIASLVKGKISGIGLMEDVGFVIELIQKIASIFKKKAPDDTVDATDTASGDDFSDLSGADKDKLTSDVKKQTDDSGADNGNDTGSGDDSGGGDTGGRKVWNSMGK
ncbi:MAG: transglutaminase-like domain-containing protein [Bacteroidia bacterium]